MKKKKKIFHNNNNKKMSLDIEQIHSNIMRSMINSQIMSSFLQRKRQEYYPVVIGGINVVRCAKLSKNAIEMIGNVYKNDIDIKYIMVGNIKSLEEQIVQTAHVDRMQFLEKLQGSPEFQRILRKEEINHNMLILTSIDDQTHHEVEGIRLSMRVALKLEYIFNNADVSIRKVIIDTGIVSNLSQGEVHFSFQRLFRPKENIPVPYILYKSIPVATCVWTYFDTARMLMLVETKYRELEDKKDKSSIEERKFIFSKYLKYLAKFTIMYLSLSETTKRNKDFDLLRDIFEKAQKELDIPIKKDISNDQKQMISTLIRFLRGKTDLKTLQFLLKYPSPSLQKQITLKI